MNQLKRLFGILWIVLAIAGAYFLISIAQSEITKKPVIDTKIQWGVFVGVFIPIMMGLVLFGYYALIGEYDKIPSSNEEL